MPFDWIAVSVRVIPWLTTFAKDRAQKLAERAADDKLADAYKHLLSSSKVEHANKAFVTRFTKELDSVIDLPTLTDESYQEALENFLCNGAVQDMVLAPLDAQSKLDADLLRGIWREMHLIELPSDFDWSQITKTYLQAIERISLADQELRSLRATVAELKTATGIERFVGPVRAFDLSRYAAALKQSYAHLNLAAIDPDWPRYRDMLLDKIFIPSSAKQALPPRDMTRDHLSAGKESKGSKKSPDKELELQSSAEAYAHLQPRRVMEVVDDVSLRRLVLLGDPGLGKSSLLKLLALRWASDQKRPLALFIELRRANRDAGYSSYLDFLDHGAGQTCCLPRLELNEYLRDNESLVLFDGLDEVSPSGRGDAVADIIKFAGDYPKARIIVTTRMYGYHPGSTYPETFRDAGFEQFTLQDFGDEEIARFIEVWHTEAFADLNERSRFALRLSSAIKDSRAIRELAANPLLITMMSMLSRNQDLPRNRPRLYEKCAELLLRNWDLEKFPELKDRKKARNVMDQLGPDEKMRILEQVAAVMQQEPTGLAGNLIGKEKLKDVVGLALPRLADYPASSIAEDLIAMLRERNFMLADLGDDHYAFIHRTFLEYFCARDLQHRLEKTSSLTIEGLREIYKQRWRQDEWREVLRLLCGLIGAEYAAQGVEELLAEEKKDGAQAVLLAAECLLEIRDLDAIEEVRTRTKNALLDLIRKVPVSKTLWDRIFSVFDVLRVQRVLGLLDKGWKDDPDVIAALKKIAAGDRRSGAWISAMEYLLKNRKDDPDVITLAEKHRREKRRG